MGRDHTLYALVEGHVKFTKEARPPPPVFQKGRKWNPWKRLVNVVQIPTSKKLVLTKIFHPTQSNSVQI